MSDTRTGNKLQASDLQTQNTDSGRQKTQSQPDTFSIFSECKIGSEHLTARLEVPDGVVDIDSWLLPIAEEVTGITNWIDICEWAGLPGKNMPVFPCGEECLPAKQPEDILRTALILSKCNDFRYLAEGPMILTRNRLDRGVRLMELNTRGFYELD